MKRIKQTRQEKRTMQQEKLQNSLSGTGSFIFENNTDGDLNLPKSTKTGLRNIGPRKRFEGDSYYMKWVGPPMNLLRLIEEIKEVIPQTLEKENVMNEEKKLILDQPDTVNNQGKIEHVITDDAVPQQNLNDSTNPDSKKKDVLLNETPVDGIEIILG
jgi:hypothetical protein